MEGAKVSGMCDNDRAKARALAERFGVPDVYDDIEDLLRYSHPDILAVCTPNHLHEIHVKTALSAGVHVFCERPLAIDLAGIQSVIEARERAGVSLIVGMNHRYRSDVQSVRGFLHRGELGSIRAVRSGWYTFRPARQALGWRRRPAQSGGGALFDLGLPLIDLALWVTGETGPFRVSATINKATGENTVEDVGSVLVACDDGPALSVDVTWRYVGESERWWCEVIGVDGSARVAPLAVFKEMHGSAVNVTPPIPAGRGSVFTASYQAQWMNFLAEIRGDVERTDLSDQLVTHRVMEAAYESARTGVTVVVPVREVDPASRG
jgi:predicted dehydrogenase